jgi:hypothetical protein
MWLLSNVFFQVQVSVVPFAILVQQYDSKLETTARPHKILLKLSENATEISECWKWLLHSKQNSTLFFEWFSKCKGLC